MADEKELVSENRPRWYSSKADPPDKKKKTGECNPKFLDEQPTVLPASRAEKSKV